MTSSLDPIFSRVTTKIGKHLKQLGFKKSGNAFRLISGGNAAIIEFQKSRDNTSERLAFTVNIAVVCGVLLDPERLTVEKSRAVDGHLRDRIGTFLPDKQDKWWRIISTTDEDALSTEVCDILCDSVAPYVLRYVDTSELLKLWESGRAPGLTEGARVDKLSALKAALKEARI